VADNLEISEGTGTTVATDQVGSAHFQKVKIADGTPDSSTMVAVDGGVEANALRVTIASDSTGVVSVDDNGGSLTVDGTVAVTNAGITTIAGAVAGTKMQVDVITMPTVTETNSGSIKTAVEVIDNAISGSEMQVDVVASLPAGTNNIGDVDVLSITNASLNGPGVPVIDSYTQVAINLAAGANQVLVSSAASKQIWVYGITFTVNVAGTVSFQDEDDTAITGIMPIDAKGGMAIAPSGNFAMPIWKLGTDKDLEVDVVTSEIDGFLTYAIVSV